MIIRSLLLLFALTLSLSHAHACPGSYAGTDQSSVDFSNQNLSGCDFTGATLSATNFTGANLSGADFTNTTVDASTLFTGANLTAITWTNFTGSISYSQMIDAEYGLFDATSQTGTSSSLHSESAHPHAGYKVTLATKDYSGQTLANVDFTGYNLDGVNFSNATLTNSIFDEANLANVNFSGADVSGASFTNALYDSRTLFPSGFNSASQGLIEVNMTYFIADSALINKHPGADLLWGTSDDIADWTTHHASFPNSNQSTANNPRGRASVSIYPTTSPVADTVEDGVNYTGYFLGGYTATDANTEEYLHLTREWATTHSQSSSYDETAGFNAYNSSSFASCARDNDNTISNCSGTWGYYMASTNYPTVSDYSTTLYAATFEETGYWLHKDQNPATVFGAGSDQALTFQYMMDVLNNAGITYDHILYTRTTNNDSVNRVNYAYGLGSTNPSATTNTVTQVPYPSWFMLALGMLLACLGYRYARY